MNSTLDAASTKDLEHGQAPAARAYSTRPSQPPAQGSRWWYVFDRWLPVTDASNGQDEFVMA